MPVLGTGRGDDTEAELDGDCDGVGCGGVGLREPIGPCFGAASLEKSPESLSHKFEKLRLTLHLLHPLEPAGGNLGCQGQVVEEVGGVFPSPLSEADLGGLSQLGEDLCLPFLRHLSASRSISTEAESGGSFVGSFSKRVHSLQGFESHKKAARIAGVTRSLIAHPISNFTPNCAFWIEDTLLAAPRTNRMSEG